MGEPKLERRDMKSTFSGIVGAIIFGTIALASSIGHTQVPRLFSYQGLMLDKNQQPATGDHDIAVDYYDASSAGSLLVGETFRKVHFHDGIFDLVLGYSPYGFPSSITFDHTMWLEITLDPGSSNEQVFPRQAMLSAPYALNTERVNGLTVTNHPVNGAIWPVPVGASGRIDASILPAPDSPPVTSLNTVGPDPSGGVSLLAGNGIALTPNASTHTVSVSVPALSDIIVSVGTTAQRPATPVQGTIRFNTDTGKFEGYDGTVWANLN